VLLNLLARWGKEVLWDELLTDDLLLGWLVNWASVVGGEVALAVTIIVSRGVIVELVLVDEGWQGRGPDGGLSNDDVGSGMNGRGHRDWCGRGSKSGGDAWWWWWWH